MKRNEPKWKRLLAKSLLQEEKDNVWNALKSTEWEARFLWPTDLDVNSLYANQVISLKKFREVYCGSFEMDINYEEK